MRNTCGQTGFSFKEEGFPLIVVPAAINALTCLTLKPLHTVVGGRSMSTLGRRNLKHKGNTDQTHYAAGHKPGMGLMVWILSVMWLLVPQ